MEQNQISCGSISDQLPPLSAKCPWLVVQNAEDDFGDQIFYTIHDPLSQYHCRIPELRGRLIRGCFHGWLILSNHPQNVMWSLWNPLTSKIICFPPLMLKDGDYESIGDCCLSAPPDDPSSVLMLTRTDESTFVFCRLDRKRWMEISYAKQLKRLALEARLLHSLTCCNGKVYALSTDGFAAIVIQVDILVEDREVVIKLLLFGAFPLITYLRCHAWTYFLKGSCTELFYITLGFHEESKEIPYDVYLFKLDMTSIKWEELECLKKNWDRTGMILEDLELDDFKDYCMTGEMWEEMQDLKDAIFFVDLDRDHSMFYNPAIASELGGYIHIRSEIDNVVYSYHVKYKTIVPSTMPSPVLSTSHVSMWECRLEDDQGAIVDSKQEEDHEVENNESHLLNIPINVLETIMECCVGVEYMNFRTTCKQCYLAAPSIQWSNETELRRLRNYSLVSPWLMVAETNRGICTFIDPISGENYFIKHSQISSIAEGIIHCSRFGWVLFESIEFECLVLLNPFTNDLRKLPDPNDYLEGLCFSAPPTSPDCMVVGFTIEGQCHARIHYVAREQKWRMFRLGVDLTSIRFPTFHGQDLYALCNSGDVIFFKNLGAEDYSKKIFQAPGNCCKSEARYYLMKCDQHLLLVIVGKYGKSVEVFKQNDSTEDWEKILDIGKHMIYICGTSSLCIDAHIPEMANKIYFPHQHSTNRKIVFYSLETCMFHTFDGKNIQETLVDLYKTAHHCNPHAWIEPSWA